jgi:hypothetical protein
MNLSTAELMALEVLRGNLDAAIPLADHLVNDVYQKGARRIEPTLRVLGNGKLLAHVRCPAHTTQQALDRVRDNVAQWLNFQNNGVIVTGGVERIDLYEIQK